MIIHEKKYFINQDQKKVKQLIMERLMNTFPEILDQNNHVEFNAQALTDLITSCLIMFMRDMFLNIHLNLPHNSETTINKIITCFFDAIRMEVNDKIKNIKKSSCH